MQPLDDEQKVEPCMFWRSLAAFMNMLSINRDQEKYYTLKHADTVDTFKQNMGKRLDIFKEAFTGDDVDHEKLEPFLKFLLDVFTPPESGGGDTDSVYNEGIFYVLDDASIAEMTFDGSENLLFYKEEPSRKSILNFLNTGNPVGETGADEAPKQLTGFLKGDDDGETADLTGLLTKNFDSSQTGREKVLSAANAYANGFMRCVQEYSFGNTQLGLNRFNLVRDVLKKKGQAAGAATYAEMFAVAGASSGDPFAGMTFSFAVPGLAAP